MSCNSFIALMILLDSYLFIKIQQRFNLHSNVYNCQHSFSSDESYSGDQMMTSRSPFRFSEEFNLVFDDSDQFFVEESIKVLRYGGVVLFWVNKRFCWHYRKNSCEFMDKLAPVQRKQDVNKQSLTYNPTVQSYCLMLSNSY